MRAKLTAGAEIDFLTRGELHDELASVTGPLISYLTEMQRGVKPLRFSAVGQVANSGILIGDSNSPTDQISPKAGYVWAVTRLTIGGIASTENVGVYINAVGQGNIIDTMPGQTLRRFGGNSLILLPEDRLIISATSGIAEPAGTNVYALGAALEVPREMAWKLF